MAEMKSEPQVPCHRLEDVTYRVNHALPAITSFAYYLIALIGSDVPYHMKKQRVSRACEACRRKKVRCFPIQGSSACHRCREQNENCLPHVPAVRGEKSRKALESLAERVDQLQRAVALTAVNPSATNEDSSSKGEQSAFSDSQEENRQSVSGVNQHIPSSLGVILADALGLTGSSCPILSSLDSTGIRDLLHIYDEAAALSPIAIRLPQDATLIKISEKPVLMLAAIVVASSSQPSFQQEVDQAFRRTLAEQAIVQGQQSIDLLLGMLTYILWYHHCFDPIRQQVYQYIELAKAMANDLEINDLDLSQCTDRDRDDIQSARLLLRYLYVGVVVLGYKRQKFSRYEIECRNPTAEREDTWLTKTCDPNKGGLLSLLHGAATAVSTFLEPIELDLTSQSCLQYIQDWAPRDGDCPAIVVTGWYAKTQLSLKLHCSGQNELEAWSDHLESCLNSSKLLIRYALQRFPSYFCTMTLVEWAQLISTLLLLPVLDAICPSTSKKTTKSLTNELRVSIAPITQHLTSRRPATLLYWIDVIVADVEGMAQGHIAVPTLLEFISSTPYELLESLTRRQIGTSKTRLTSHATPKHIVNEDSQPTAGAPFEETLWRDILTQWLDLSGSQ